jgi:hypothetical protein
MYAMCVTPQRCALCVAQELYASGLLAHDSRMHWEGVEVAKYWEKVGLGFAVLGFGVRGLG